MIHLIYVCTCVLGVEYGFLSSLMLKLLQGSLSETLIGFDITYTPLFTYICTNKYLYTHVHVYTYKCILGLLSVEENYSIHFCLVFYRVWNVLLVIVHMMFNLVFYFVQCFLFPLLYVLCLCYVIFSLFHPKTVGQVEQHDSFLGFLMFVLTVSSHWVEHTL